METFTANDAKQHFGQLMDKALQGPVSITKHGRPAVVVTSSEEYQQLLMLRHEKLKQEVRLGFEQLDRGEYSELDADQIAEESLQRYLRKKS